MSFGFDDEREFTPGQGQLQVSAACGVTGSWGQHQITGTLDKGKGTLIGAIEWSDGDIATFTAVRPGR